MQKPFTHHKQPYKPTQEVFNRPLEVFQVFFRDPWSLKDQGKAEQIKIDQSRAGQGRAKQFRAGQKKTQTRKSIASKARQSRTEQRNQKKLDRNELYIMVHTYIRKGRSVAHCVCIYNTYTDILYMSVICPRTAEKSQAILCLGRRKCWGWWCWWLTVTRNAGNWSRRSVHINSLMSAAYETQKRNTFLAIKKHRQTRRHDKHQAILYEHDNLQQPLIFYLNHLIIRVGWGC